MVIGDVLSVMAALENATEICRRVASCIIWLKWAQSSRGPDGKVSNDDRKTLAL